MQNIFSSIHCMVPVIDFLTQFRCLPVSVFGVFEHWIVNLELHGFIIVQPDEKFEFEKLFLILLLRSVEFMLLPVSLSDKHHMSEVTYQKSLPLINYSNVLLQLPNSYTNYTHVESNDTFLRSCPKPNAFCSMRRST